MRLGLAVEPYAYDKVAISFLRKSTNDKDSKHCPEIFAQYKEKEKAMFPFIYCVSHAAFVGQRIEICDPLKRDHGPYIASEKQDKLGVCIAIVATKQKNKVMCNLAPSGKSQKECVRLYNDPSVVYGYEDPYVFFNGSIELN